MAWTGLAAGLDRLEPAARARLDAIQKISLAKGKTVFHPGESARGFLVVLSGRIEVSLIGPTGREILLYAVEPGQSCVQTTLGLLGGEDYTGEALCATECEAVLIPREVFLGLMDSSAVFRGFVFGAFADRMQGMMHLLERLAFQRIESRLAQALLERAEGDRVAATHQDLAAMIGSAREVVSRRLELFSQNGWVGTERGTVILRDLAALRQLAAGAAYM